ncbi:hypothetical protein FKM82_001210 [Ascaphus truei]
MTVCNLPVYRTQEAMSDQSHPLLPVFLLEETLVTIFYWHYSISTVVVTTNTLISLFQWAHLCHFRQCCPTTTPLSSTHCIVFQNKQREVWFGD